MQITIQFDRINSFGEKETVKEGTETSGRKSRDAIKTAFKLFALKPEAVIRVDNRIFEWDSFDKQIVKTICEYKTETLPLKKAEKMALRTKKND